MSEDGHDREFGLSRTIEADVRLTLGDLLRANLWHFFSRWPIRVSYALLALSVAVILVGAARPAAVALDPRVVIFVLIWLIALPGLTVWTAWSQHRQLQAKGTTTSWSFSAVRVEVASPASSATMSWDAFERVVETRNAFYLFQQKRLFYPIPARAFRTAADLEGVRDLFRSKLGSRAKLKAA